MIIKESILIITTQTLTIANHKQDKRAQNTSSLMFFSHCCLRIHWACRASPAAAVAEAGATGCWSAGH